MTRTIIASALALAFVTGNALAQPRAAPSAGTGARATLDCLPLTAAMQSAGAWPRRAPVPDAVLLHPVACTADGAMPETRPFVLGAHAYLTRNYAEALRLWTIADAEGSVSATYFLAGMHADGKGVQQDGVRAIALYRQVAEAGDTVPLRGAVAGATISNQAMLNLARIYDDGYPARADDLKVTAPSMGDYWNAGARIRDKSEAAIWYRRWARAIDPSTPYAEQAAFALRQLQIKP